MESTTLVNVSVLEDPKSANFWDANAQLALVPEFAAVRRLDGEYVANEEGNPYSSLVMWAAFFESDPDEEINRLYRLGRGEIRAFLAETMFSDAQPAPYEKPWFSDVLQRYDDLCLPAAGRILALEVRSMRERAELIANTKLTVDENEKVYRTITEDVILRDEYGEPVLDADSRHVKRTESHKILDKIIVVKGNSDKIETMRKGTPAMMKKYRELEDEFTSAKAAIQVWGNKTRSAIDEGLI